MVCRYFFYYIVFPLFFNVFYDLRLGILTYDINYVKIHTELSLNALLLSEDIGH